MKDGLYKDAVGLWGVDMQLDMVIEECSELIKAICKYKRSSNKEMDVALVADEHADVKVMLEQLSYMMAVHDNPDHKSYEQLKESFREDKLKRLAYRIEEAKEINKLRRCKLTDITVGNAGGNR